MGFYQPAQIVMDARKHGVEVRPVDINHSHWDNTLEKTPFPRGEGRGDAALRLGFRQVKGIREEDIKLLVSAREKKYTSIHELRGIGLSDAALEKLADADAFRSIDLDRRQALWEISAMDRSVALFTGQPSADEKRENILLPQMTAAEHVMHDYAAMALSLKAHPVSFMREKLQQLHILSTSELATTARDGQPVKVAGLVLLRQRPETAGGICFMTIEDETGVANLVIFPNLFEEYRKEILQSKLIMVEGQLQIQGEVIHVIVKRCYDFSKLLRKLTLSNNENYSSPFRAGAETPQVLTLARPDKKSSPPRQNKRSQLRENEQEKLFPEARNFR
jgi:error-prone DNA polymerase